MERLWVHDRIRQKRASKEISCDSDDNTSSFPGNIRDFQLKVVGAAARKDDESKSIKETNRRSLLSADLMNKYLKFKMSARLILHSKAALKFSLTPASQKQQQSADSV